MKEKSENSKKGITLVALVITIIIMLILATVTIGAINGGLLDYAQKATSKQDLATLLEKFYPIQVIPEKENINGTVSEILGDDLGKFDDSFKVSKGELIYTGNDPKIIENLLELGVNESSIENKSLLCPVLEHDFTPANYLEPKTCKRCGYTEGSKLVATAPHPDQQNSTDIGIGTDGQLVNLDKWKYYKSSLKWILNGYLGNYLEPNGEIEGKVPQIINNVEVAGMNYTFDSATNLKTAPLLPATVTDVFGTFSQCSNLENFEEGFTFENLKSISYLFERCPKIKTLPETAILSDQITTCSSMFRGCSGLVGLPQKFTIPYGCKNIDAMFMGCSSLENLPKDFSIPTTINVMSNVLNGCSSLSSLPEGFAIPNGVTSLYAAFYHCENLKTLPENFTIPASVNNMDLIFSYCKKIEGSITLVGNPTTYDRFFDNVATTGNGLTVKYTDACTNIEAIKATKSSNSKITFVNISGATDTE